MPMLLGSFFFSGFAALVYQLVWQRSLFDIFGVNIESITMVVAAFMLGLGLGGPVGGRLSRLSRPSPLVVFALLEIATGTYGIVSIPLFDKVSVLVLGASPLATFILSFAMIVIPTVLMGATLPVLVSFMVRWKDNVGQSVGILYFVNTLGSATACYLVTFWMFWNLGMSGSANLAAAVNFTIGIGALLMSRYTSLAKAPDPVPPAAMDSALRTKIRRSAALCGLVGFISLSYEIIWARVYSFIIRGHAAGFSMMLSFFLFGIAIGSLVAHLHCRGDGAGTNGRWRPRAVSNFILVANMVGFAVVPIAALMITASFSFAAVLPLVTFGAAMLGAALPLLSHYALPPDGRAGGGLGYLYLSNIMGAVAGTLITGFVLLDVLGVQGTSVALFLLGAAVSVGLALQETGKTRRRLIAVIVFVAVGVTAISGQLFDGIYRRLSPTLEAEAKGKLADLIETRSGIITATKSGLVFGNGAYDGHFNTDILSDINGIIRPYSISAFHPAPRNVLMIGLGTGSWAKVIAANPEIKHLTIIEINPGYVTLVRRNRYVSSILDNRKVEIIIDDGRRWLAKNHDRRFDFIISNSTYYFRAYVSNLLSVEYLNLIRSHLADGGMFYYNATGSERAHRTAAMVFPYAYRSTTMMLVSDKPVVFDSSRWRRVLQNMSIDGRRYDISDPATRERFDRILAYYDRRASFDPNSPWKPGYENRRDILARTAGMPVITDDNMGEEWDLSGSGRH